QRYWDGTAWTEHTYDPTPPPLRAPEGTNPNTVWMWLLSIGGPLATIAIVAFEFFWIGSLSTTDFSDPAATYSAIYTPTYYLLIACGWILYAALVVVGWLDYRRLRALSVPKPFHWAWSFLSSVVYVIGRSVVVKRRTGTGLAPLWVFVALEVTTFIVAIVVGILLVAAIIQNVANAYPVP
ncbi:MAG TPA: DUF2510 domain-containing protein, partial [Galbitalea sp.]